MATSIGPRRGARVQLNGLIQANDTFTCRAATYTALEEVEVAEPAMLSRQAVVRRGRRTPACGGRLCIRRRVRRRQRLVAQPGVSTARHARCTTPSPIPPRLSCIGV